ncbi:dodecin [Novosphingobium album (ex Hu et al. 2023)]|uniref:Dodecin family protein n=1 Tax=Novosphingobium album (ex Hu et al. 2023) TaxID=2930093 RepID=A0ABT0B7L9_9SPHN|nr:dodecin [Novosphingobium album (ex Hu et al. 2023)]MCJ2181018.1 dodecin family protein [Novosphingobium album (ex Hu et al. 2023)]
MQDHVFKLTEIVGTSSQSIDAAITAALGRARSSIRNVRWFEVTGTRGSIDEAGAIQYQVSLKVGFTLED